MRLLFTIDTKDYDTAGTVMVRPSVRAVIIRNGMVAMVHSLQYDYYKFPGGGMEPGEKQTDTLIRETREEAGLLVIPESSREYGYVHRIQKGKDVDCFIQDNYYYLCDVLPEAADQQLDDYEAAERFTLEWLPPEAAIRANRKPDHGPKDQNMILREARVLELLIREGYFSSP